MDSALSMSLASLQMPMPHNTFALGYLRLLSQRMRSGRCVQLGCGKGEQLRAIANSFRNDIELWGLDDCKMMVAKARSLIDRQKLVHMKAEYCAMTSLPLERDSVQCVVSMEKIHQHSHSAVWKEIWRVLSSGGTFVVTDLYLVDPWDAPVSEATEHLVTRSEYLQFLEELGFKDVRVLEEMESFDLAGREVATFTITGVKP